LDGGMSFFKERDYGGCGVEESYGDKSIRQALLWKYKTFTPQVKKEFAGLILNLRGMARELSYVLAKEIKNNPKLAEVMTDNSKFFVSKYGEEADVIIKAVEKQLKSPKGFAFAIHDALNGEKAKVALHGFKYKPAYGEYILEYTKANLPKKNKTSKSKNLLR
jgi:hypothetical protein